MAAKSTLSNEEVVLSESEKKQFNGGDAKAPFNLTEWLSHEVKLPQYCDIFLEQGFQSPSDCCEIDETVLDLLGIDKIGHRKRILVSCQKLAARFGLSNQLVSSTSRTYDDEIKAQQSLSQAINQIGEDDARPALPPKRGKMSKPRRTPSAGESAKTIEQEVNKSSLLLSDISTEHCAKLSDSTSLPRMESNPASKDEERIGDLTNKVENPTATTYGSSPGLPSGSPTQGYEPIWEASEGDPQAVSPKETTQEPGHFGGMPGTGDFPASVVDVESTESQLAPAKKPPIPPRADLDDPKANASQPPHDNSDYETLWKAYGNNAVENAPNPPPELVEKKPEGEQSIAKKRVAPRKPPRKPKPFSMLIQPGSIFAENELNGKFSPIVRSLSETFVSQRKEDEKENFGLEEQVFSSDEKEPIVDQPENVTRKNEDADLGDGNIYGNAEEIQKLPRMTLDTTKPVPVLKKPIPAPRSKSISGLEMKPPSRLVVESVPGIVLLNIFM